MDNNILEFIAENQKVINEQANIVPLTSWQKKFKLNKDGEIKSSSIVNIELILENDEILKDKIVYDEFSGFMYLKEDIPEINRKKGTWQDSFNAALLSYIEREYSVVFKSESLNNALVNVSHRNVFNSAKHRIEQQSWDGIERGKSFFIDLVGSDENLYIQEVTKRWLTGLIARVYNPACKFEIVPVLDGKQGIGKSTATRLLVGDDLFTDSLDSLGEKKDDYLQIRGNLIIELGELSSMNKTKIEKVKNFISATHDNIREPYARYTTKWARTCVFIGTSNDSSYLKDGTGNRRFFPIPCRNEPKLDMFTVDDEYFLQVLAEAKVWYENGQIIHFDDKTDTEILELAGQYREAAEVESPMKEAVLKYLEMEVPYGWNEAPLFAKQQYYARYPESMDDEDLVRQIDHNFCEAFKLTDVLTSDILSIVFRRQTEDHLNGRADSDAKKIARIIENVDGWKAGQIYRFNNKRGYKNEENRKYSRKLF